MSHRITIDIFKSEYEEIISVLAKNGRADLINILRKRRDDDYKPKNKEFHEYYYSTDSEDDDSEAAESYTMSDVVIDSEGHWSLKEK